MDNSVYLIDDDAAVRDALSLLLGLRGYRTLVFADGSTFLDALRPDWHGCLLLDIRMPNMDGLALQRELLARGCAMPVIIITGHGDVATAREAFRANAVDFLEKPLDQERLFAAIDEAFAQQRATTAVTRRRQEYERRLATLTPREQEVMDLVIAGRHNREIAGKLEISVRTVEVHKARLMTKLGASSFSQLVRISLGVETLSGDGSVQS